MHSAFYEGTVRHRRLGRTRHGFRHRIAMAYLDLSEVPTLLGGRLVRRSPGALRFRRDDFLGNPAVSLDVAVRDLVAVQTGVRPTGAVRVLTQLRSFGHSFNPVSFYYCFNADDTLAAVVAEVTNTPWRERHAYVVPAASGPSHRATLDKQLHVSPFFGMDQKYSFTFHTPGESLVVGITNREGNARAFEAGLHLERRPCDAKTARRISRRYAVPSLRTLALIYAHAVVLRLKGVRVHRHPEAVAR